MSPNDKESKMTSFTSTARDDARREIIASLPEQETPAKAARQTFFFGLAITAIYTAISYAMQKAINDMIDDYS